MKKLLKYMAVGVLTIFASCGSADLSPAEMVEKGLEEYNSANYYEAAEWFRKAAELDYAQAQNNLGMLYKYGAGVEQDLAKAAYWFTKAAEQGNEDAIANLKNLQNNAVMPASEDEPDADKIDETKTEPEAIAVEPAPVSKVGKSASTEKQPSDTSSPKPKSDNFTPKSYFFTGYVTNGQGGWVTTGQAEAAKEISLSDNKIIGLGETFTYTGQISLFNIPLRAYVCDSNREMLVLRYGNELIVAMTTYGLFLSELQQVGVANQRLSRKNISGWYNATALAMPNTPSGAQSATSQQKVARTCTLCNGTGKYLPEYSSQYRVAGGGEPVKYWCDICKKYDYSHYHKTCPSCGGKGVVK
ncbi:MAG: tetratricopeptide repeat protein [Muribaculaceae bacterium]